MASVGSREGGHGDNDSKTGGRNKNGSFFVRYCSAPELPLDNVGTTNCKGGDDNCKRDGNNIGSVFKYSGHDIVVQREGVNRASSASDRPQTTNRDQLVINTKLLLMVYARYNLLMALIAVNFIVCFA